MDAQEHGHAGAGPQDSDILQSLAHLLGALRAAARADGQVADSLARVGSWLREFAAATQAQTHAEGSVAAGGPPAAVEVVHTDERRVKRELALGGQRVHLMVRDADGAVVEPPPIERREALVAPVVETRRAVAGLDVVSKRCRLKAECCRWASERRQRIADGVDFDQLVKPTDEELANKLRALPDCYAWPLDPYVSLPAERSLDDASGCYECLGDAVDMVTRVRADEAMFEEHGQRAYELLAESCSALRHILSECGIDRDNDQDDAFDWLRTRTFEDRIYIARHMRLSDPAAPATWPDRRDAIRHLVGHIEQQHSQVKEAKNLLGRVSYIAKRWSDFQDDEALAQAAKLAEAIERLVAIGIKASDPRLRDPLLSIADELPPDLEVSGAFAEALRYADEHAARLEADGRAERSQPATTSRELQEARELLADRTLVLIGGECRPRSRDALREGLGLRELRWVPTRPHESIGNFEAQVRRDDVDLVLLAIRWSSHSFAEVKAICDAAGKPFVRLPRGYGVNQVAADVVNQASRALAHRA